MKEERNQKSMKNGGINGVNNKHHGGNIKY